jgi:predicted  nucleic acid-binding Zn-ribbon protein
MEHEYTTRIADLEKGIAVLQEKNHNDNSKKTELEKKLAAETTINQDSMKKSKENFATEKKNLTKEIEKLRVKSYEQELELVECQANYDKDMALWQGKVEFLEQQREQLKSEIAESTTHFNMMFNKLKEHRVADKEDAESVKHAELIALEQRFLNEISEIREQHRGYVSDVEETNRKLDKENRKMKDLVNNSDSK